MSCFHFAAITGWALEKFANMPITRHLIIRHIGLNLSLRRPLFAFQSACILMPLDIFDISQRAEGEGEVDFIENYFHEMKRLIYRVSLAYWLMPVTAEALADAKLIMLRHFSNASSRYTLILGAWQAYRWWTPDIIISLLSSGGTPRRMLCAGAPRAQRRVDENLIVCMPSNTRCIRFAHFAERALALIQE